MIRKFTRRATASLCACVAAHQAWEYVNRDAKFEKQMKIVFPFFEANQQLRVDVLSRNQLEYAIKQCNYYSKRAHALGSKNESGEPDVILNTEKMAQQYLSAAGHLVCEPGVKLKSVPHKTFPGYCQSVEQACLMNEPLLYAHKDGLFGTKVVRLGAVLGSGYPIQTGGNMSSDAF